MGIFRKILFCLAAFFTAWLHPCEESFEAIANGSGHWAVEQMGLSHSEVRGLEVSPEFREIFLQLVELHRTLQPLHPDHLFFETLGNGLTAPSNGCAEDIQEHVNLRFALIGISVKQSGLEIEPWHQFLLLPYVGGFPAVPTVVHTPKNRLELFEETFAEFKRFQWEQVYEIIKAHPFYDGLKPNSGTLKKILAGKKGDHVREAFKEGIKSTVLDLMDDYLFKHANQIRAAAREDSTAEALFVAFDEWSVRNNVTPELKILVRKVILVNLVHEAGLAVPKNAKLKQEILDDLVQQMHDLRDRHLAENERLEEMESTGRAFSSGAPLPLIPEIAGVLASPRSESHFPIVSRRRQKAQRAEQSDVTTGADVEELKSTPQNDGNLIEVFMWDESYRARFLRQLSDARVRLTTKESKRLSDNFYFVLRELHRGQHPRTLGLKPEGSKAPDIYGFSPLGSSATIRIFFARLGDQFYILRLVSDIKSGVETENRILAELQKEAQSLKYSLQTGN